MDYKLKKDAKCAVIGYGSWGTALVKILLENEERVGWYVANEYVLESLVSNGRNPKYLSDVDFDDMVDRLDISDDLNYILDTYDILIFAVPSVFLNTVMDKAAVSFKDKFVISSIKGIVNDGNNNLITVAEYFNQKFDVPFKQIGIITGPCHAEEVALERLSYLNVVCTDSENADMIASKIRCSYIMVNTLADIYGTEYSVVLKNIYAIAVGMCSGLGYGDNFIAVLIANAARESKRFLDMTYASAERDINTSPYLGDLLVTSYSQFSRNRTFGVMIGKGYSVQSVKMEMKMIAEGYFATKCIHEINRQKGVDMPIVDTVYGVLYENKSGKREFQKLTKLLK